jgi:hypothetical protein
MKERRRAYSTHESRKPRSAQRLETAVLKSIRGLLSRRFPHPRLIPHTSPHQYGLHPLHLVPLHIVYLHKLATRHLSQRLGAPTSRKPCQLVKRTNLQALVSLSQTNCAMRPNLLPTSLPSSKASPLPSTRTKSGLTYPSGKEFKYRLVTVIKKLRSGDYAAFVHGEDGRWWGCVR